MTTKGWKRRRGKEKKGERERKQKTKKRKIETNLPTNKNGQK